MKKPANSSFFDKARRLVAARASLVLVKTHEELRLERLLGSLAQKAFSQPVPLGLWSVTEGLKIGDDVIPDTQEPEAALSAVIDAQRPALYLFRDLHHFYDDTKVVRRLRDLARALRANYKTVFVSAPIHTLPLDLHKDLAVLDLPLPDLTDMARVFTEVCATMKNTEVDLGDTLDALHRGGLGLTEEEARAAFTKLLVGKRKVGPELIDQLYLEKREIVAKEGILDYIPPNVSLDNIGGLVVLKEWLKARLRFFSNEAEAFGLDPPKGLLITGISGCGKSLAVKAVSSYWHMPMVRLDMNRVYAGVAGTPEATLERAIHTAEAIAPCVLWIDEIETALVGTSGVAGAATRIFSSFLTWMQEKEQMVFVAATANEIDKLPPELLRKGRFDEIFFVDLPNEQERVEIFSVHLARRNKDPAAFDLSSLSKSTPGFNGAEIEQVVLAAMYLAFDEDREVTMKDLYRSLGRMVPLSTTMAERIKVIKRWADTRAVKASR